MAHGQRDHLKLGGLKFKYYQLRCYPDQQKAFSLALSLDVTAGVSQYQVNNLFERRLGRRLALQKPMV